MRTLKFIVSKQTIRPDPSCDFTGIVPGTRGYLRAEFSFNSDWDGCRKAAVFYKYDKQYPAPIKNGACMIPAEALKAKTFAVSVVGERDGYRITTNKVEVRQNG